MQFRKAAEEAQMQIKTLFREYERKVHDSGFG